MVIKAIIMDHICGGANRRTKGLYLSFEEIQSLSGQKKITALKEVKEEWPLFPPCSI